MEIEVTPVIRSMDALREWFFSNGHTKFNLYSGYNKDNSIRSTAKDDLQDAAQAWDELQKALGWHNYKGSYTLLVTDSKNGTGGGKTVRLALRGEDSTSVASIAGLAQINGMMTREQVEQMIQADRQAREIEDLKAQIAGLANAKPAKMGAFERLLDRAIEDEGSGNEAIKGLADGVRSIGEGLKFFLMKQADKGAQPPPPRPPRPEKAADTEGGEDYNGEDILKMFDRTEELIPDADPLKVHNAVIDLFNEMDAGTKAFMIDKLKSKL